MVKTYPIHYPGPGDTPYVPLADYKRLEAKYERLRELVKEAAEVIEIAHSQHNDEAEGK